MKVGKLYKRIDDMSQDCAITLLKDDDGDIIVGVMSRLHSSGGLLKLSVEYCVDGRSPHVLRLLPALAEAIELDNQEHPIASIEAEKSCAMDHLDPSQGAERRQAEQRLMPQECQCSCHLPIEEGPLRTKHVAPCCYPCVCGLNFISGLEEHQRYCEAYLISQQQG